MTKQEIQKRIAELKASPRVMLGSTEGSHTGPVNYYKWGRVEDGHEYYTRKFAGQPEEVCGEKEAKDGGDGRYASYTQNSYDFRAKCNELAKLERMLASAA